MPCLLWALSHHQDSSKDTQGAYCVLGLCHMYHVLNTSTVSSCFCVLWLFTTFNNWVHKVWSQKQSLIFGSLRRVTCVAPADNARTLQNMHQAQKCCIQCTASLQCQQWASFQFLVCQIWNSDDTPATYLMFCNVWPEHLWRTRETREDKERQGETRRDKERQGETRRDKSAQIISGSISLSSSHPVISSRELCFAVIAKVTSGLLISPSSKWTEQRERKYPRYWGRILLEAHWIGRIYEGLLRAGCIILQRLAIHVSWNIHLGNARIFCYEVFIMAPWDPLTEWLDESIFWWSLSFLGISGWW